MSEGGTHVAGTRSAGNTDLPEAGKRGRLAIADQVVRSIARLAAAEVSGTVPGEGGWHARRLPRAQARVAGDRTRVSVEVGARWPSPLPVVAAAVRDTVASRLRELTGLTVDAVDVTVEAVLPPDEVQQNRSVQ